MSALRTSVQNALASARSGTGAAVLIAGRGGTGLTHELASAATMATQTGMGLAYAGGRAAERPLAFGVTVDLLAGFERNAGDDLRTGPGAAAIGLLTGTVASDATRDGGTAIIRSVWALAQHRREGLAVIVDDLHDVDAPSLRLLAYGAARISDWPIALISAHRIGTEAVEPAALRAIAAVSPVIAPPLLDDDEAAALVRTRLPDASVALCVACVRATGANPGLLAALAADLARTRGPTAELDPGRVQRTVGPAVTAVLGDRVARLPVPARRLAHMLAAHDGPVSAAQAATESGLDPDAAALAIDALVADGLLADAVPLTLAQPLLRTAIRASLTLSQRIRLPPVGLAESLAAAQSPGGPAALPAADALTPSEGRVAELAARGMTTKEIAMELFVTPKTVEFHLRNVYRKLEIPSSRTYLAHALAAVPRRPGRPGGAPVTPFPPS